jgi:CubicO group peptidase (beta-lactamase class C family)
VDTQFAVASVAKSVVATAVLLLVDRGLLSLDGPAGDGGMTVHQLLTHTSGLGHWSAVGGIELFCSLSTEDRLAAVRAAPRRPRAGAAWSYSGLGYFLLGDLVERRTDRPYGAFVGEEVFAPLGMDASVSGAAPAGRDPVLQRSTVPGTDDLWSTAADLARFSAALRTGELLSARSYRSMTTPHVKLADVPATIGVVTASGYGYGTFLGAIDGVPAAFHPGDNPGCRSFSGSLPSTDTSIVVLLEGDDDSALIDLVTRTVRSAAS